MKHLATPALLALACLPLVMTAPAAAADAGPEMLGFSSVEIDPIFDAMLKPRERGYLGADGAASIALSPGRILWVFGDTTLGTSYGGARKGPMVRNSIAIQDHSAGFPGTVEYFWNIEDRLIGDFFRPDSPQDPHWYWPGCGVNHDGTVYLFLTKLTQGEGEAGFAFQSDNCTLVRIRNHEEHPDNWVTEKVDLGFGNQHFNINVASLIEGEHVYLLGYDDGPEKNPMNRAAILGRLPLAALASEAPGSQMEFWSKGGAWRKDTEALEPLFRPGTTEGGLYYDKSIGRYITGTIQPFSPHMFLASAEKLTGPWTVQPVYDIPQLLNRPDDNYHAYTPRVHPLLSPGDGTVIMTYVINAKDFWSAFSDMDIYYPRFVRVEIAK
jgi:hypothetical protein